MDFTSFLSDFIKLHKITNAKLAEKLEVPAATISHLLSGRNKPSLDFIQRLIKAYPALDLYEILELKKHDKYDSKESAVDNEKKDSTLDLFSNAALKNKKVKKVVLFYEDNSFEEYNL